jgi:hypothetical protein
MRKNVHMTVTRALLYGAGVWAILIAVAVVFESLFNSSGPEHMAPIPAALIGAVFLGWIPASIVAVWRYRK